MRLHQLHIENIGTFLEGTIDFITPEDNPQKPPVVIITGENGTGKTLILDAIREFFGGYYRQKAPKIRNIIRNNGSPTIRLTLEYLSQTILTFYSNATHKHLDGHSYAFYLSNEHEFIEPNYRHLDFSRFGHKGSSKPDWIVNYWTSKLSSDDFELEALNSPNIEEYLQDSLSGVHQNKEVTALICYFDYLRNSESPREKELGEFLYETLKKIIKLSLDKGELSHVQRTSLTPIIKQGDLEITLDKLSSGNLYFIQRMVSMLGKMYAVGMLHDKPVEEICLTEGLLLIDEAENHLHPKWQKTFIQNVLSIFPNLQIILTTHSPFIVSSVENARVYVCESQGDHSIIKDATADYSNKPIEEVLISEAFNGTQPFNAEISALLQARKEAIESGNEKEAQAIEAKLLKINRQHFSYFEIDKLLAEITHR